MRIFLVAALAAGCLFQAQGAPVIAANARIYIDADSGLETALPAALQKERVAVNVTTDRSKADLVVESSARLIDVKSGDVIFAQTVDANASRHTRQNVAEACAKHLAAVVGTSKRSGKSLKTKKSRLRSLIAKDPAFSF